MSVRTPVATGVGHCSGGAYHLSAGRTVVAAGRVGSTHKLSYVHTKLTRSKLPHHACVGSAHKDLVIILHNK